MLREAEPNRDAPGRVRGAGWVGIAAIALATLGYVGLTFAVAREDSRQFQLDRARNIARGVAWVFTQEQLREDDDAEGLTERFVAALPKNVAGLQEALVLKSTTYVAHSDAAQTGARLDRDSLEDKALYDRHQRLRQEWKKNIEERERRPELEQNAYAELVFETGADGSLEVYAPAAVDERFRALVRIRTAPVEHRGGFNSLLVLIALVGMVAIVVMTRVGGDRLLRFGGAALVFAVGIAMTMSMSQWRDQLRRSLAEERGQALLELEDSSLSDAAAPDEESSLVDALNRTEFARDDGSISALGSGDARRPEGGVLVEGDRGWAHFGERWLEHRAGDDFAGFALWGLLFSLVAALIYLLGVQGQLERAGHSLAVHRVAYAYLSPAMLGMAVLVFIPVVYGIVLGFQARSYNVFEFVGFRNYLEILSDLNVAETRNFYFKVAVTMLWTFTNVALHVSIGLFLALLLNDPMLKARGIFRVVLVIPWAIPNYITALIWKGLYHKQFGAVNAFLQTLGFEPRSWFQDFWSAFFTNLSTNTWLGFPFMMVVSLGALQSIPSDLYEAARVDGASRWQRFRNITLPLLMPALVPAVIVGTIWTFNMFNIIYLVSGGAPNGATDILITDAFRWAFERDRYGYAAAYSTLIFVILLVFTLITNRFTGATKGAFE
ncbi:MAG: sugar ABC transporter permease [Myxococcota bacterium]